MVAGKAAHLPLEHPVAWAHLLELAPDVALFQEVTRLPESVTDSYETVHRGAVGKTGRPQRFGSTVLASGKIMGEVPLVARERSAWLATRTGCSANGSVTISPSSRTLNPKGGTLEARAALGSARACELS